MRKLLLNSCIIGLLIESICLPNFGALAAENVASTSAKANKSATSLPESKKGADPVEHTAEGVHYNKKKGDQAGMADIGLSALSAGLAAMAMIDRIFGATKQHADTTKKSQLLSAIQVYPAWMDSVWFPVFISFDPVGSLISLGHAAVNKFMRDATNITASFTGAEGFVTDKWVGPHPRNTTVDIMGDVSVTSQKFDALSFDPDEYKGMQNPEKASARELMDYRSQELLEDQRSLSNVTDAQWGVLYRAQQRSIKGLASALELKELLKELGEIEEKISADYKNKPSALNSVASRRALNDALLLLKMNVMAARTKIRSETLELDFKTKTKESETDDEDKDDDTDDGEDDE